MYEPKRYDKVFYTGLEKAYNSILFTVVGTRIASNGDTVAALDGMRDGNLVSIQCGDMNVLNYCYNSEPKFAEDDIIWILDNDTNVPISGVVVDVSPSLTNESNSYLVRFDFGDRAIYESQCIAYDPSWPVVDSSPVTYKHIQKVAETLNKIATDLIHRGMVHDASKLENPEKLFLDILQARLDIESQAPYGSDQYRQNTKILKPMLKSHYAKNSHHAEHYTNGLYNMTLMDVIEMFADWYAASIRGGDPVVGLSISAERFVMSDQLKQIFANTYDQLGMKWI